MSLKELFLMRQGIAFHIFHSEALASFDIFMQRWTGRASYAGRNVESAGTDLASIREWNWTSEGGNTNKSRHITQGNGV